MIYLIDDKKSRQELLGWGKDRLEEFDAILKTVYTYKQIKDQNLSKEVFSDNNIILFHESFFDNVENKSKEESKNVREKLRIWAQDKKIVLIKFSGAINTRDYQKNQATIPVNILYRNLEIFLKSCSQKEEGEISIKKLLFGENYQIEEILLLKKEIWETKFKLSPTLNNKINELNSLTNKSINLKITQDPTILKSLINE